MCQEEWTEAPVNIVQFDRAFLPERSSRSGIGGAVEVSECLTSIVLLKGSHPEASGSLTSLVKKQHAVYIRHRNFQIHIPFWSLPSTCPKRTSDPRT